MMSLIVTRTLKILAVLFIEIFIFGMGEYVQEKEHDHDTEVASRILFMFFTTILICLVW